jgi:tetratricopeptide (TPR) repeat protein
MSAVQRKRAALRWILWIGGASLCQPLAAAEPEVSPELLDLAGRIEWGYYAREERVIEAARAGLGRLSANETLGAYYDGLAAYRLALLRAAGDGRGIGELLDACVARAEDSIGRDEVVAEAWILTAACAALGARHEPLKAVLHQRRLEQSLQRARQIDMGNPRLLVVETWRLSQRPAHESAEIQAQAQGQLEAALDGFAQGSAQLGWPDWGEAEALAHLGEIRLRLGDARGARDYVERALLVAPDYDFALSLQKRVLSSR